LGRHQGSSTVPTSLPGDLAAMVRHGPRVLVAEGAPSFPLAFRVGALLAKGFPLASRASSFPLALRVHRAFGVPWAPTALRDHPGATGAPMAPGEAPRVPLWVAPRAPGDPCQPLLS